MAFDEFKRPLTLFAAHFLVFSYSHNSETHATTYHELLRALTASKSGTRLLSDMEEWMILLEPSIPPS